MKKNEDSRPFRVGSGDSSALYHHCVDEISAYVLAGGMSSRMGSDKAFLELNGSSLLSHAIDLASTVCERVTIVGSPAKFSSMGRVIPDIYAGCGPLGGIHAALVDSATDLNFILGVDLPFLEIRFLRLLIDQSKSSEAMVTIPRTDYFQTLCAVYRKNFALVAEESLTKGRNKIDALFAGITVRVIDDQELLAEGFARSMFRNLNTPDDLQIARREFKS